MYMNDPKDQEIIDALVNEVVLAVNARLEAAAEACEEYSGKCPEIIRSFKVTPKQINVVRT